MASNRIPADIEKYRPGPCTEIKPINGHYYVYMYQAVQLPSGKWGKKTGKSIGKIVSDVGFIPNKNYHLFRGEDSQDDITVLEYGQYALAEFIAKDILEALKRCFPIDRAIQIFVYSCILFVNDFVHADQIQIYYEQSWLSQEYKKIPFSMKKTSIKTLLDDLGRKTKRVIKYETSSVGNSSSAIAIDGHVIRSCSDENDLAETGYKFKLLKEDQVNLLMGYDINTGIPLFAKMYRGSCNDNSTIEDLNDVLQFTGVLFVIDRGFYSEKKSQNPCLK